MHPLRKKAELDDIVPFFRIFRWFSCWKRKPSFQHSLRKTLLEELEIKMPKSDSQVDSEPFMLLGYGINAFFDIMMSLMFMFICITLFLIPVYYVYS